MTGIGADGLHSRVRTLTFGATEGVERFLGYIVAAFEITGAYRPRDRMTERCWQETGLSPSPTAHEKGHPT